MANHAFKVKKGLDVGGNATIDSDLTVKGGITSTGTIQGNLTGNVTGTTSDISNHNTGDLTEGSNLYHTTARARTAISAGGDLAYNSSTGVISYTDSDRTASQIRGLLSANGDLSYNASTGVMSFTADSAAVNTAQARASVSATDAGGDGSFSYNQGSGVFTYTGPSSSEVRAHLTANKGLSVSNGEFNIDSANVKGMFSGGTGVTYSNGAISIGQAVATSDNVTFNDLVVSGNLSILGSQTDVATTNLTVTDKNITIADSSTSSALTDGAGLTFGAWSSGTIPTFTWNHSAQRLVSNYAIGANLVGNVTGNLTGNVTGTTSDISNHNTGDLTEGSNLYYTNARARGSISVTDAGGDGSASYNSSTGVITYTGPSASEVRAHVSANKGLSVTNGQFNIDSDNVKGMFSASGSLSYNSSTGAFSYTDSDRTASQIRGLVSAGGDLSYNNSTGVVSFTERTDAEVRGLLSAGGDLSYNSSTGAFSITKFTTANARSSISITDAGGDGSLSYNSSTGVITYTGPSAAQVRAHLSASGDLSYNSSTGAFSYSKQTSAQLLTSIKTVDGASSGLDADLLDGQHGSYYRDAGNFNAGKIPFDRYTVSSSGDRWGDKIVHTASDGVTDVGKMIDFYDSDGDTTDNSVRLTGGLNKLTSNQALYVNSNRVLTTADEGSGNGIDADTLDGQHGTYYRINVYNNSGTLLN